MAATRLYVSTTGSKKGTRILPGSAPQVFTGHHQRAAHDTPGGQGEGAGVFRGGAAVG